MSTQANKRVFLTTIQILSVVFFVMFTLWFAWVMNTIFEVKKGNYTLQNGDKVIAVIDGYMTRGNHNDRYIPLYSYVDENGIKYSGMVEWGWESSEEEVRKHYGEKVENVIDGKGDSVLSTYKVQSLAGYIIADVALGLVIVAMIMLFALETTKRVKKVKRYRDLFKKNKEAPNA
ncbi:MAG: hypothetical protein NC033_01000 [Clostridiales bacterium]|nr:hypothetical protein [Clostridiales bacterium]